MKLQDVLTVVGTAVLTTAATLMLLGPRTDSLAYAAPEVKPVIAQPQFQSQGCTFVLKTDKATYEAGESPAIEITASNPSDKPVHATIWVSISASAPASPMAHRMPMPRSLWSHECVVSLQPGETKNLTIPCDAKLPAGQSISIIMTDKKETIRAASPDIQARVAPGQQQLNVLQQQLNAAPATGATR